MYRTWLKEIKLQLSVYHSVYKIMGCCAVLTSVDLLLFKRKLKGCYVLVLYLKYIKHLTLIKGLNFLTSVQGISNSVFQEL